MFSWLKARANWPFGSVVLIYIIFTLALTYPVACNLSNSVAGYEGEDNVYSVWTSWWFKTALLDLHTSPANTSYLYYPVGLYQTMLTATPYTELSSLPLVLLFGPVVAYNLIFLFSFFLTALFTYLLCYQLTGNRWASLAGGFIFAFSPMRTIHATAGHFTQSMTYWFPLYALFLLRLLQKPNRRDAVLCGLFLALSSLISLMHIAYFVIPFTLAVFLYEFWQDRKAFFSMLPRNGGQAANEPPAWLGGTARLRYLTLALGVAAAITAPFFLPFLWQRLAGNWSFLDRPGTIDYAADLLAFFTPSPYHPLFSRLPIQPFLEKVMYGYPFENLLYLGWVPLLLAWYGRKGKTAQLWIGLGLVTGILSLGPLLKVGGELVHYVIEDKITYLLLPYALIKRLPLYEMSRTPARLTEPLMLCLAVLVALGLARFWQNWQARRGRLALILVALGAIAFEYLTLWPLPLTPAPSPAFYRQIASDGQDYAILDIPLLNRRVLGFSMYYQTIHQHRIVGGYLWRFPTEAMNMMRLIESLVAAPSAADIVPDSTEVDALGLIGRYNIRYVTLHKGELPAPSTEEAYKTTFQKAWGPAVYTDDRLMVFAVPQAPVSGVQGLTFASVGEGWHTLEAWEGVPTRWLSNEGALFFLQPIERTYHLRFNAYPFLRTRHVQVLVNQQPVDQVTVGEWQEVVTKPFRLRQGLNVVEFRVQEGCEKPSAVLADALDGRCLSIAVQKGELLP